MEVYSCCLELGSCDAVGGNCGGDSVSDYREGSRSGLGNWDCVGLGHGGRRQSVAYVRCRVQA